MPASEALEESDSATTSQAALSAAHQAIGHDDIGRACAWAHLAARLARSEHDIAAEARALVCLAHCDRLTSHVRRACDSSRQAARLFSSIGDAEGEASALTSLVHVSILVGHNDEAIEAALLGVELCTPRAPHAPTLQSVLAYNGLGLAYSWAGSAERAHAAFDTAIDLALRCHPPLSLRQPLVNQAWTEARRLADERYHTGRLGSLDKLRTLMQAIEQQECAGQAASLVAGLEALGRTLTLVHKCIFAAWSGDTALAESHGAAAMDSLAAQPTWIDAAVRWAKAEVCLATGDRAGAETCLSRMKSIAVDCEHEQMACMAHLLLIHVFELRGNMPALLAEQRALRWRERRMVHDSIVGKETIVALRLSARKTELHLRHALDQSRQFEQWSLEDALTGAPNRRRFAMDLKNALSRAQDPCRQTTVAMIDVDRFKSINDRFTHEVGDRVLKTLALIMASEIREEDMLARWAGDEFVIRFATDIEAAAIICQRIREAVDRFDWDCVATGLQVSITIGLGIAVQGDTVESLVRRSDESMYGMKPRRDAQLSIQ